MNYEELYAQLQALQREMSDLIKNQQKAYKSLCKNLENGDLKSAAKDISALDSIQGDCGALLDDIRNKVELFSGREYIESGDFTQQMLAECERIGVDVKGDFPVYEMFPYKIKIDTDSLDLFVDRKKVQSFRPSKFVSDIKSGQDKLLKAPFNAMVFANELADAYDLALLKQSKGKPYAKDSDFYLTSLYNYLTPMRRFRKDYDRQSFAFDLSRLFSCDLFSIDDGRKFQFGPSRNINKAIRVLDKDLHEQFLATIRFY